MIGSLLVIISLAVSVGLQPSLRNSNVGVRYGLASFGSATEEHADAVKYAFSLYASETSQSDLKEDSNTIVISNILVENVTDSSATVAWMTNKPANSQVLWWEDIYVRDSSEVDSSLQLNHAVRLYVLKPAHIYQFFVRSCDSAGCGNSALAKLKTLSNRPLAGKLPPDTMLGFGILRCDSIVSTAMPMLTIRNADSSRSNEYVFEVASDSLFRTVVTNSFAVRQETGDRTSWKVDTLLMIGSRYYWRATCNTRRLSEVCAFSIAEKLAPHAYPNPWKMGLFPYITFTGLPADSKLILMTVSGNVIRSWETQTGADIIWNGLDSTGGYVKSGVYKGTCLAQDGQEQSQFKLMILSK